MFKYKPELSVIKMSESETVQLHSFNTFNNFVNNHPKCYNSDDSDGKKYKLRLKFDGSCALEVVRLNGGHFQNLTHLDISGNSAEKLDLRSLGRLEWLCCSNNQLEVLTLSGTSLTYLDCSRNNLQYIMVDPIPNNLSTLQASFNNLEELPTWTWIIPELFTIYASNNRLCQIDCKFQNSLSHLPIRELYLHCNKIEFVSKDFIQRATRLKILNISQNLVQVMPNLGRRCNIQELYMSRNRLEDTSERSALDFLSECTSMKRLHLAFNKIEHLNDKCMTTWKNLEELVLCGNRIRALPSKMSSLTNLRVLRLHSNLLQIPPNLTKMPALKVVDLSHNNLKRINLENLISAGNLTYLDISCNERLSLDPERLNNPGNRPMNLVEVTNPRKAPTCKKWEFPANPPWELGFSELPDRNQNLSIAQYRDVNLASGKSALFGLFDGGDGNPGPKSIARGISKIFDEERNIEDSLKFSLKYTLLNSLRNFRREGNTEPMNGALCLLSTHEENESLGKQSFTLDLAVIGNVRCILVQSGKKICYLSDNSDEKRNEEDDNKENDSNKSFSSDDLSSASASKSGHTTIHDPKVISIAITPTVEYLIIANQSICDNVSEQELSNELMSYEKSVLLAKRITDLAQSHSCKESLSLILVRFIWNTSGGLIINRVSSKAKSAVSGEYGPLSYYSGSSECSDDITNPLASVTTPDSAIESDRSSGTSNESKERSQTQGTENRRVIKTITTADHKNNINNSDNTSLTNTSTMSVEQFRCWEYMLEQNTRLLFKKELDTLSKAAFPRNQRLRKSVHFPYKSENSSYETGKESQRSKKSAMSGFYTLSKTKSLTNLFGDEPMKTKSSGSRKSITSDLFTRGPAKQQSQAPTLTPKSHFPLFTNGNAGFLEGIRSARGTILGGPNAAYFGSAQRLMPSSFAIVQKPTPSPGEIQERNLDFSEQDSRVKKYWDNKITEL